DDKKRKAIECDEAWMKAPIVFPSVSMEDSSDEPLTITSVMEGYLVRKVYVDQGALVERNKSSRVEDQGKLGTKWEGPYRVREAYHNGSYKLRTME
ncbi:hypothetical protein Tco_1578976, partial [Tanacetum coccineum]